MKTTKPRRPAAPKRRLRPGLRGRTVLIGLGLRPALVLSVGYTVFGEPQVIVAMLDVPADAPPLDLGGGVTCSPRARWLTGIEQCEALLEPRKETRR